MLAVALTRN